MRAAAKGTRETAKGAGRRARRDAYRQQLLDAAERVFAARGYPGTRMQDVAAEAGVALGTVYALVDGKEELWAAIHEARGRELLERAARATQGSGSSFAALLSGVRAYVEFLVEHPDYLRLQLQESQPWALKPRFTSAGQMRQWREGLVLTEGVFRAAIAEGAIVDEDPSVLARLMIAAHQVYLGEWVEAGMKEGAESLVERMQRHVRRAFGRGRGRVGNGEAREEGRSVVGMGR